MIVELPVEEIILPGEGDETGNVSFFLNTIPGVVERHDQAGWYMSMTFQLWVEMGKPLGIRATLEGVG